MAKLRGGLITAIAGYGTYIIDSYRMSAADAHYLREVEIAICPLGRCSVL